MIASVIVLQALNGLSDREAVEALTFDLRWKAACGYPVDKKAFDASSLTVWRARLAASERPQRIFEVVRDVIDATGAVKGRTRRALDSTILDDAVARQDTVTQLIAQVRRVGREVPGAQQVIEQRCTRLAALTGQGYDSTGKPRIAWDDRQARDELVTALVNDALALLAGLDAEAITAAGGKPAEAVALLALVAGQDVEPAEGSVGTDGRWRIARRVAPDRVISTVDPDARHAHKTVERRQDGFKAHVVIEPDTGLATMVELTKAAGPDNSDATVGARLVVDASISIAQRFGVPELIISLTLVSIGTSLPELATSIVAAIRRQSDISLGNIVGSNIFNIAGVLGLSAAIRPLALGTDVVYRDIPVMVGSAVLCLPVMMFRGKITRIEGSIFLAMYVAYTALLFVMTKG